MTTRIMLATGLALAAAVGAAAQPPAAPARYREYALGASLASVVTATGARDVAPKTLHIRPELLQTLEWRRPYAGPDDAMADPVRDMLFHFVGDALYRIDVHYDRDRTLGLTSSDLVDAISLAYGPPRASTDPRALAVRDLGGDMAVVRRWALPEATLTLLTGVDSPDYLLVLVSTPLSARASAAARQAERLDQREAPQRAIDAHRKDLRDAQDAQLRARARNKPAFRP